MTTKKTIEELLGECKMREPSFTLWHDPESGIVRVQWGPEGARVERRYKLGTVGVTSEHVEHAKRTLLADALALLPNGFAS